MAYFLGNPINFKRFKVKSEVELINFGKNKKLIPNQFSSYNPPLV